MRSRTFALPEDTNNFKDLSEKRQRWRKKPHFPLKVPPFLLFVFFYFQGWGQSWTRDKAIMFGDSSTVMIIEVIKVSVDSFQHQHDNNLSAKEKKKFTWGCLQLYYQYRGTLALHLSVSPSLPAARIIRMLHAYYNTNPSKASALYVSVCIMCCALCF